MTIAVGDRIPDATFTMIGDSGPVRLTTDELFAGRKVALFGVPGAFTPTCHNKHVPSFVNAAEQLAGKGVDDILCVVIENPFVAKAWSDATGAGAAGIKIVSDANAVFTHAAGLDFYAAPDSRVPKSKRYSMYVEDKVVKVLNVEEATGQAVCSIGEVLVDQI